MNNRALEYNSDQAWPNGYGGGLAPAGTCGNPFAGLAPESQEFYLATKDFQVAEALTVDGFFGPVSLKAYTSKFGTPSLEVAGLDISGWQDPDDYIQNNHDPEEIQFRELRRVGFQWVIIKAVQGVNRKMARHAKAHTENAIKEGTLHSHYTFSTPWSNFKDDSRPEAERFVDCLIELDKELGEGKILPAWDLENKGYTKNRKGQVTSGQEMWELWEGRRGGGRQEYRQRMTDWSLSWLERFLELWGSYPLLYSYPSFLRSRIYNEPEIAKCPLWLAAYTLSNPLKKYNVWDQYTLVAQQTGSKGNAQSQKVYEGSLDINRAPYGLDPLLRVNALTA